MINKISIDELSEHLSGYRTEGPCAWNSSAEVCKERVIKTMRKWVDVIVYLFF